MSDIGARVVSMADITDFLSAFSLPPTIVQRTRELIAQGRLRTDNLYTIVMDAGLNDFLLAQAIQEEWTRFCPNSPSPQFALSHLPSQPNQNQQSNRIDKFPQASGSLSSSSIVMPDFGSMAFRSPRLSPRPHPPHTMDGATQTDMHAFDHTREEIIARLSRDAELQDHDILALENNVVHLQHELHNAHARILQLEGIVKAQRQQLDQHLLSPATDVSQTDALRNTVRDLALAYADILTSVHRGPGAATEDSTQRQLHALERILAALPTARPSSPPHSPAPPWRSALRGEPRGEEGDGVQGREMRRQLRALTESYQALRWFRPAESDEREVTPGVVHRLKSMVQHTQPAQPAARGHARSPPPSKVVPNTVVLPVSPSAWMQPSHTQTPAQPARQAPPPTETTPGEVAGLHPIHTYSQQDVQRLLYAPTGLCAPRRPASACSACSTSTNGSRKSKTAREKGRGPSPRNLSLSRPGRQVVGYDFDVRGVLRAMAP